MPFEKLVIGRPITGMWGPKHDYIEDIEKTAKALKDDVMYAKKKTRGPGIYGTWK